MPTILIVDDNEDDEFFTRRAIKKANIDAKIVIARDGAEALDCLFGTNSIEVVLPDLVFLDLKMPKISGLEVLKKVRADNKTRLIPVVVYTSSSEEQDIYESYGCGANSYVCKPIEFDLLARVVKSVVEYWLFLNKPSSKA